MQRQNSRRPYRVVVHGLPNFCEKLPGLLGSESWDVRDYSKHLLSDFPAFVNDLRRCDLAYTWGGRITKGKFLWAARLLGKRKIVMLWCGSDVLLAQREFADNKMDPWLAGMTHWAVSPALAANVRAFGLSCEYVPASFVSPVACPSPLPKKFSVLTYAPSAAKAKFYGWDAILQAAEMFPSVEFNLVGLPREETLPAPPNVKLHTFANDITPLVKETAVGWRPIQHDGGTSFFVLELLAHGRHVLYTNPHPGCIHVATTEAACNELKRLRTLHELGELKSNNEGIEYVAQYCTPERVRTELLTRWEKVITSGIHPLVTA